MLKKSIMLASSNNYKTANVAAESDNEDIGDERQGIFLSIYSSFPKVKYSALILSIKIYYYIQVFIFCVD